MVAGAVGGDAGGTVRSERTQSRNATLAIYDVPRVRDGRSSPIDAHGRAASK